MALICYTDKANEFTSASGIPERWVEGNWTRDTSGYWDYAPERYHIA